MHRLSFSVVGAERCSSQPPRLPNHQIELANEVHNSSSRNTLGTIAVGGVAQADRHELAWALYIAEACDLQSLAQVGSCLSCMFLEVSRTASGPGRLWLTTMAVSEQRAIATLQVLPCTS